MEFCRSCGWSEDGTCHDLVGRPGFHGRCEKCGRTGGITYEAEPMIETPMTFDFSAFPNTIKEKKK